MLFRSKRMKALDAIFTQNAEVAAKSQFFKAPSLHRVWNHIGAERQQAQWGYMQALLRTLGMVNMVAPLLPADSLQRFQEMKAQGIGPAEIATTFMNDVMSRPDGMLGDLMQGKPQAAAQTMQTLQEYLLKGKDAKQNKKTREQLEGYLDQMKELTTSTDATGAAAPAADASEEIGRAHV